MQELEIKPAYSGKHYDNMLLTGCRRMMMIVQRLSIYGCTQSVNVQLFVY